jgi:hypothetical protein
MNARIQSVFNRLAELRDRDLFNAWSRRVWELTKELHPIDAVLAEKEAGRHIATGIELEDYLPETFRSGTLSKLERFVSIDDRGRIRHRTTP